MLKSKPHVLMIAVFDPRSTNNSQADGFEKNGCDVTRYDYRRALVRINKKQRDDEIIEVCRNLRPDIVFFSKCNDVSAEVVKQCKSICTTVLWYMDPPENVDYELMCKAQLADVIAVALWGPFVTLRDHFPLKTHFVHEGFDHNANKIIPGLSYKYDVSFIGSLRGTRQDYFNHLHFNHFENSYGEDHSRVVCQSRINLNLTAGNQGTSDRLYKLLASKGFVLSEPWPMMEHDFIPGQDFVLINSPQEAADMIQFYLNNPSAREPIAQSGFSRVQKFSRINFARRILDICEGIKK